jgi:hypothetical protein
MACGVACYTEAVILLFEPSARLATARWSICQFLDAESQVYAGSLRLKARSLERLQ